MRLLLLLVGLTAACSGSAPAPWVPTSGDGLGSDAGASRLSPDASAGSALDGGAAVHPSDAGPHPSLADGSVASNEEGILLAKDGRGSDELGQATAVSGNTVVAGAWNQGVVGAGDARLSGAAYVYVQAGQTWKQQAKLKASNPKFNVHFGFSVAIDGDTAVVGAPWETSAAVGVNGTNPGQEDSSADRAGAAYVFKRNGGTWSQQAYLKASNAEALDMFGRSVAISGDTVVVGAPSEASCATAAGGDQKDNACSGSGAAYVFVRKQGVWTQQAYLKSPNNSDQYFGEVAISGDTIAVRELRQTDVFVRSADAWTVQDHWVFDHTCSLACLSLSGDTLVAGDVDEDDMRGAAHVFTRNSGAWSEQPRLLASNGEAGDRFGAVAISGDVIVVGAQAEDGSTKGLHNSAPDPADNAGTNSGAAYVFTRASGTWTQTAYLKAGTPGSADDFGVSVGVSGKSIVVGADTHDTSQRMDDGAAYVFGL